MWRRATREPRSLDDAHIARTKRFLWKKAIASKLRRGGTRCQRETPAADDAVGSVFHPEPDTRVGTPPGRIERYAKLTSGPPAELQGRQLPRCREKQSDRKHDSPSAAVESPRIDQDPLKSGSRDLDWSSLGTLPPAWGTECTLCLPVALCQLDARLHA